MHVIEDLQRFAELEELHKLQLSLGQARIAFLEDTLARETVILGDLKINAREDTI